MQIADTKHVECPKCGESERVTPPAEDVELKIRTSVAAFGEHSKIHCSQGHTYWVYYCK